MSTGIIRSTKNAFVSNTHPRIFEEAYSLVDKGANSIRKKSSPEGVKIPMMYEFTGIHADGNDGENSVQRKGALSRDGTVAEKNKPDSLSNLFH